jgi:signal transduction histidine kinase
LSYVVEEDVPNIVVSDPSRLRQILVNIISNGLKFTSQGRVTVRCSVDLTASIECAQDETVLKYEVIDTGIGISEQEQTLLFMPFSQVDGSTTRKYGGTGLGVCVHLFCPSSFG